MKFNNATIELNGIKEIVFNRATLWMRRDRRWLKFRIADFKKADLDAAHEGKLTVKATGGVSEEEMHGILSHHMQPGSRYEVSVSGATINVKRKIGKKQVKKDVKQSNL